MKLIDNRYRLSKILGDNANSTSYLAIDLWNTSKKYELKLYNDVEKQKEVIDYFIKNFIMLGNIKHENLLKNKEFTIVKNIDRKRSKIQKYYYIIEYISDSTLDAVKDELSLEKKLYIILQLCIVLDYLHFRGIIYKHLSPSNIYIAKNGKIKLRDLATIKDMTMNNNYSYITRYFVAPEVLLGKKDIDKKADFYSLGMIILYLFQDNFYTNFNECFHIDKNYKLKEEQKEFLEKQVSYLTKGNAFSRHGNLQEIIKDMIEIFNLDYEYDIVKERENLNFKTKIIGRENEIKKILEADKYFELGDYNFSLFLIEGEEGLGKTRLLSEINHQLELRGRDLYNIEIKKDDNIGLGFISEFLRQTVKDTPPNLLDKYCCELAKILPELKFLERVSPSEVLSKEKEKFRLYNRITRYIEDLAKIKPLYITIDNLHNVSKWSLGFLNYIVYNLRNSPILIVMTYDRSKIEKDTLVYKTLDQWKTMKYISEISLSKFNVNEIGEMIKYILGINYKPMNFSAALLKETFGNPRYIELVIKNLFVTEELYISKNGSWEVNVEKYTDLYYPTSFNEVLKNQVNLLDEKFKDVLKTISLFNSSVRKEILQKMECFETEDLNNIIEELVIMGLLDERLGDWGYSYNIYNLQLKRLVYRKISKNKRKALHKKVAQILEKNYRDNKIVNIEELVHHLERSEQVDKAIDCLVEEARKAGALFSTQALYLWEMAYDLSKNKGKGYRQLEIIESMGSIYIYKGENEKALEKYNEALYEAKKLKKIKYIIRCNIAIGRIYHKRDKKELAMQYALENKRLSQNIGYIDGLLQAIILIAQIEVDKGNLKLVVGTVKGGIKIAKREGRKEYLGSLYNLLGRANYYKGCLNEAKCNFERSIETFRLAGNYV